MVSIKLKCPKVKRCYHFFRLNDFRLLRIWPIIPFRTTSAYVTFEISSKVTWTCPFSRKWKLASRCKARPTESQASEENTDGSLYWERPRWEVSNVIQSASIIFCWNRNWTRIALMTDFTCRRGHFLTMFTSNINRQ